MTPPTAELRAMIDRALREWAMGHGGRTDAAIIADWREWLSEECDRIDEATARMAGDDARAVAA